MIFGGADLDRSGFDLVFADEFPGPALDPHRWIDHYLPHWTVSERSIARYRFGDFGVELRIDSEQPAWRAEDGELRVSNLQTGSFSGPLGSDRGQHRHRPDLLVRSPQPTRRLWTPTAGLIEATVQASADPTCMLGIWLVGFAERSPQESGEICVAELFGDAINPEQSQVRVGIKAHDDPGLVTDMTDLVLDLDATESHTYAAQWNAERVRFYVDEQLVRTVGQGLDYPLQLMIDLFEFPDGSARPAEEYPKTGTVSSVRGYRPRG